MQKLLLDLIKEERPVSRLQLAELSLYRFRKFDDIGHRRSKSADITSDLFCCSGTSGTESPKAATALLSDRRTPVKDSPTPVLPGSGGVDSSGVGEDLGRGRRGGADVPSPG